MTGYSLVRHGLCENFLPAHLLRNDDQWAIGIFGTRWGSQLDCIQVGFNCRLKRISSACLHTKLPGHPAAFYPPGWPSSLSSCSPRAFSRRSLFSTQRSKDRQSPATVLSQHAQEGGAHAHPAGFRPGACAHFSAWLSKRDVNSNCSYTTSRIHDKPMGPAASHRVSDYPCLAPSPSRAMVAEQISYHAPGTWPCTLHGPPAHGPSHASSHRRISPVWPPAVFQNRPTNQVVTSATNSVALGRKQQIADLSGYSRIVAA